VVPVLPPPHSAFGRRGAPGFFSFFLFLWLFFLFPFFAGTPAFPPAFAAGLSRRWVAGRRFPLIFHPQQFFFSPGTSFLAPTIPLNILWVFPNVASLLGSSGHARCV